MPELPEVETIRARLDPEVAGRTVTAAWGFGVPRYAGAAELAGARVEGVRRRGKYLLVETDDGREAVVHLGMTGVLSFDLGGPEPGPHVRAWWELDDGRRLVLTDPRRFGRVTLVDRGDYSSIPTLAALGPEPFDTSFTPEALWAGLGRSRARTKTKLLNQRIVAGVGNIYADEALWHAGIHPAGRRTSRPAAARLHEAVVDVLAAGIAHGGTTFRDYRALDGARGGHQDHLVCYGRHGQPCPRCGTTMRRGVVDGRGSTWCPTCQRR